MRRALILSSLVLLIGCGAKSGAPPDIDAATVYAKTMPTRINQLTYLFKQCDGTALLGINDVAQHKKVPEPIIEGLAKCVKDVRTWISINKALQPTRRFQAFHDEFLAQAGQIAEEYEELGTDLKKGSTAEMIAFAQKNEANSKIRKEKLTKVMDGKTIDQFLAFGH